MSVSDLTPALSRADWLKGDGTDDGDTLTEWCLSRESLSIVKAEMLLPLSTRATNKIVSRLSLAALSDCYMRTIMAVSLHFFFFFFFLPADFILIFEVFKHHE